jgi:D-proline reductase (dithiol) PrdB
MCNQSVGLIQSVIEKSGIATVGISLLREVTKAVNPPRTLFVDRPLGYPLGQPNNPALQKEIIMRALGLLQDPGSLPIVEDFRE